MLGVIEIQWWHWPIFLAIILVLLAFDLGVFHRHAHVVRVGEAMRWTTLWVVLALGFALFLRYWRNTEEALEYLTGYVIELSLSMDNVFVIALIFAYFSVPLRFQHRVLFWGILGAMIMRGIMIGLGTALIARFHWVLYVMGAFLVVSGVKMVASPQESVHPEKNPVVRLARRWFRVSTEFDGQRFVSRVNGQRVLTPLALVLLMIETSDLIFALDSIPAIFAVTRRPFIVFTSNVFAILGLRSLYFMLAGAITYFRFLKAGLSVVLVFIGLKMLLGNWLVIPTLISLAVVGGIILISILASVWSTRSKRGHA
ncbi:MAG: TerC family protein [Candidatus Omnitrophica bacterium]|nr:TerC family protein [Candidatus Omnitrophota bacterium]